MKNRREFIKTLSAGGAGLILPLQVNARLSSKAKKESLKFSLCADVHKDIMHDADTRLQAFIEDATENELDFIMQLGDFCRPYDYNLGFMSIWNSFPGKKYHVIGNHDMDGGFKRDQVVAYWQAEGRHYSFDLKGYHFIVLDGNDEDPSENRPAGYARYLGREQLSWLEKDLEHTDLPSLVFCHQGLDNDLGGIHNATQSRLVLERANERAGFQKVQVVFSGHHHQDYYNNINGIHYLQINSMSYQWLGEQYKHVRYSEEVDKNFPWIKYTVPYKDPLWARVEISSGNTLRLYGRKSSYVGPSPEELGVDMHTFGYPVIPRISDRELRLTIP
jgi:3',5'-cyclic AMP phosphodiesterase CpdA